MNAFVCVPISARLAGEVILRSRKPNYDLGDLVEFLLQGFLDRTRGDADIWSEEHANEIGEELEDLGDSDKGYQWLDVFLPNGSKIRMTYKGKNHYAEVRHEKVMYEDKLVSPSEFASLVAAGTSRNAWRDLWIKFPASTEWKFADILRKEKR